MPARERPSIFSAGNPRKPATNCVRSAASISSNFTDSTCANCTAASSPSGHCKAARTAASSASGQSAGSAAGTRNATVAGAPQCGHAAAVVLSDWLHSVQVAMLIWPVYPANAPSTTRVITNYFSYGGVAIILVGC